MTKEKIITTPEAEKRNFVLKIKRTVETKNPYGVSNFQESEAHIHYEVSNLSELTKKVKKMLNSYSQEERKRLTYKVSEISNIDLPNL